MQFKVVFNIVLLCFIILDCLVILASTFLFAKHTDSEKNKIIDEKIAKVKSVSYIVFFALMIFMMLVNLIV